ncbi:hypothetical protein BP6252_13251 [Coleophoma cylindrospora]|uniref:PPPDE domain-containing protein n=1 Tax=Coleophoma cylindrospora TaxID=1849047 RepID=A0A3D8QAA9_9HELO|nr:hypothetical protein BP6252_13251 [Coleophoma cylindrospora]
MESIDAQRTPPISAALLSQTPEQYPSTLGDFAAHDVSGGKLMRKIESTLYNLSGLPTGLSTGRELKSVHFAKQLNRSLPRTIDGARESHHVFVVSVPHIGWIVSPRHWSVYSQGYFYHLSADVGKSELGGCGCGNNPTGAPATIRLKIEDLSSPQTPDYTRAQEEGRKMKAFVAFEVGQTQYLPSNMHILAQGIIDQLSAYDLLEANCQIFASTLLHRVVMTQRDCSTFAGTMVQLVDWDLRGRHKAGAEQPRNVNEGYLLRRPILRTPDIMFPALSISFASLNWYEARAIRLLYERGPMTIGAMDPTGERHWLMYALLMIGKRIKTNRSLRRTEAMVAGTADDLA